MTSMIAKEIVIIALFGKTINVAKMLILGIGSQKPKMERWSGIEEATYLGWGWLPDSRLVFCDWMRPTVTYSIGEVTPVTIWSIEEEDEGNVNDYFEYPRYCHHHYVRFLPQKAYIPTENITSSAIAGLYLPQADTIQPAHFQTMKLIKEEYERLGIPLEYLEQALKYSYQHQGEKIR